MKTKELVIAAYDKDLSWINDVDKNIKKTIYRKGSELKNENEILVTPNVGRCVHSFFNHIYNRYDTLSDYTFFVQDYPFDHWGNLLEILHDDVEQYPNKATLNFGGYFGFINTCSRSFCPLSHRENASRLSPYRPLLLPARPPYRRDFHPAH